MIKNLFKYNINDDYNDLLMFQIPTMSKYIIFGDLHGNIKKLIDYLILSKYISFHSKDTYNNFFIDINSIEPFTINLKKYFNILKSNLKLILLGDCFGDRNKHEILKLIIFNKISKVNDFNILYGNHDNAAYSLLNRRKANCVPTNQEFAKAFYKYDIKIIRNLFLNLINKHYKLCLLINDNIFLSHAPINLNSINSYIDFFEIANENINDIVININQYLNEQLNKGIINDTFLLDFIWGRYYGDSKYHLVNFKNIKTQICGHDTFNSNNEKLISLDNLNGKIKDFNETEKFIIF